MRKGEKERMSKRCLPLVGRHFAIFNYIINLQKRQQKIESLTFLQ